MLLCACDGERRKHHRPGGGPPPYMGAEPAPSLFGIDTSLYDSSYANFIRDIPAAHRMGARWDHFTIGVGTGRGDYSALDHLVEQAKRNGMGVILSFGGIGSACSLKPRPRNIHACPPRPPTTWASMRPTSARWCSTTATWSTTTRLDRAEQQVVVPPRPEHQRVRGRAEGSICGVPSVNSQYGLHLKLLFGSPSDFSVIPGTHGFIAVLPFTNRVLRDLHGQRAFDGIALHAYRFPPQPYGPSARAYDYVGGLGVKRGAGGRPRRRLDSSPWCQMTWPEELSAYQQEFADHGYGAQPLWLTEFGWPGNADPSGGYFPSEAIQARDLSKAYGALLRLPFVQAALWFNLRDYQPGFKSPDPAFFYHYGLLGYGFSPKPAATEFEALARDNPGR